MSSDQIRPGSTAAPAGLLEFGPGRHASLADRFEERVAERPGHPFLIWEGARISYAEANAQANRFARFLQAQGVQQADTVALMAENSPEFLYLWIALSKLGCIAALINTQVRSDALVHALRVSESDWLLIGAECLDKLQTVGSALAHVPTFVLGREGIDVEAPGHARPLPADLSELSGANLERSGPARPDPERTLCLIFTSGTTGLSKACRLSNRRWLGTGDSVSSVLELSRDEIFYGVLPLFHSAGGGALLSTVVATGGTLVLRRKFSASRFWDDAREHGVTFVQYLGELCRYLLNRPPDARDGQHRIRYFAGSGLNARAFTRFRERFRIPHIVESYGGTDLNVGLSNLDNKPGACGRIPWDEDGPIRLVRYDVENDCLVRDERGFLIDAGVDEPGEFLSRLPREPGASAGRFEGYMDPDATEQKTLRDAFEPGDAYLRSGDLLKRDAEGYCYFVDRMGDTFRWKGENVSTAEVSTALSGHPGMEMHVIYGVEVPGHEGRAGMAAIVMQANRQFDPSAFYQLAREQLPPYAIPIFVRVAEAADMTATFKLRTVDLKRRGYAPDMPGERLYVLDAKAGSYVPLSDAALARLDLPPFSRSAGG